MAACCFGGDGLRRFWFCRTASIHQKTNTGSPPRRYFDTCAFLLWIIICQPRLFVPPVLVFLFQMPRSWLREGERIRSRSNSTPQTHQEQNPSDSVDACLPSGRSFPPVPPGVSSSGAHPMSHCGFACLPRQALVVSSSRLCLCRTVPACPCLRHAGADRALLFMVFFENWRALREPGAAAPPSAYLKTRP